MRSSLDNISGHLTSFRGRESQRAWPAIDSRSYSHLVFGNICLTGIVGRASMPSPVSRRFVPYRCSLSYSIPTRVIAVGLPVALLHH